MADTTDNLVLEHLRHIRAKVDRTDQRLDSVEMRIGAIERILSGHHVSEFNQNEELDRLKLRMDRVEKRLQLVD
jgi:hypothetical protein